MALLFGAAVLEAGGDALMRMGLRASGPVRAAVLIVGAGLVLTIYGYLVNTPPWDFGRLIGVYVAMFFVVAQSISWFAFHQKPSPLLLVGGSLIVVGGVVVSFAG
jgi:small multidrug resistance family-3 protein